MPINLHYFVSIFFFTVILEIKALLECDFKVEARSAPNSAIF